MCQKSVKYYLNNSQSITFKINLNKTACTAVAVAQTKPKYFCKDPNINFTFKNFSTVSTA